MNNYTKQDIESFNSKDRRISFLSIFSSLTGMFENQSINEEKFLNTTKAIAKIAHEINDEVYMKYPFPVQTPIITPTNGAYNENCPKCGSPLKEKSGVKNGRKWSGQFCTNPACKHVIWSPKHVAKQEFQTQMATDEVNQVNYNEREYTG